MNSHKRPISNRRRWRRQQTVRAVLITVACVLLALFVGFVIVGNVLLNKTARTDSPGDETDTPTSDEPQPLPEARKLQGYPILAETTDTSTFSSRLGKLTDKGATAVSLPLNTEDNALLYRSPVGEELGWQTAGAYTVTLTRVVEIADQAGVYISGTFYLTALHEEDDLVRSVALAEASAVAVEALRAGVDDLLFLVPDLTGAQSADLIRFLEGIRALEPSAVLGLAVSPSLLSQADGNTILSELDGYLNYLALDVTQVGDNNAAAHVDATIHDTENHYQLLYYNMRLLLPAGTDDAEESAILSVVEGSGIQNWQILTQP